MLTKVRMFFLKAMMYLCDAKIAFCLDEAKVEMINEGWMNLKWKDTDKRNQISDFEEIKEGDHCIYFKFLL